MRFILVSCCAAVGATCAFGGVWDDCGWWFRGGRDGVTVNGKCETGEFFDETHANDPTHVAHQLGIYGYPEGRLFRTEPVAFPCSNGETNDLQCLYLPRILDVSQDGSTTNLFPANVATYDLFKNINVTNDYTIIARLRRDEGLAGANGQPDSRYNVFFRAGYNGYFGAELGFAGVVTNSDGSVAGKGLQLYTCKADGSGAAGKAWTYTDGFLVPTNMWIDVSMTVRGGTIRVGCARPETIACAGRTRAAICFQQFATADGRLSMTNVAAAAHPVNTASGWRFFCEGAQTGVLSYDKAIKNCFCGSVQQIGVWNRALSDEEVLEAWGAPRPALFRIGLHNGSTAEFAGVRTGAAQTFDAGAYWRDRSPQLAAGDTWTVNFSVSRQDAGLAQLVVFKATSASASGTVRAVVNGRDLGVQDVTTGGSSAWTVPKGVIAAGANSLTLARTDAGAEALEMDVMSVEGSCQRGLANDDFTEIAEEWLVVPSLQSTATANLRHQQRALHTVPTGSIATNLRIQVYADEEAVRRATQLTIRTRRNSRGAGHQGTGDERADVYLNGTLCGWLEMGLSVWQNNRFNFRPGTLREGLNTVEFRVPLTDGPSWVIDYWRFGLKPATSPVLAFRGATAHEWDSYPMLDTSESCFSADGLPFLYPRDGAAEKVTDAVTGKTGVLCMSTTAVNNFGVRFDRAAYVVGALAPKFPPHHSGTLAVTVTTLTPGAYGLRLEIADWHSNIVTIEKIAPELRTVGTHTVLVDIPHEFAADSKGRVSGAFALIGIRFLFLDAQSGQSVRIDGCDFAYRTETKANALAMEMDVGAEPRVLTPATAARGATVRLRNKAKQTGAFDVALRLTDYAGTEVGWNRSETVTLAADEAATYSVPCPAKYGAYYVTADVRVHGDAAAKPSTLKRSFGYLDLTGATPDVKFPEGLPMGTVGHMQAYFGNEAEMTKMADAMAQIGLKILRVDFSPDESSIPFFDKVVEVFRERGINFDFILPQPKTNNRVDLVGYRASWRAAFARYRGKVRFWELINEPDISWSGSMIITPEEYAALAAQTQADLREADPDARLMSSGFCTFSDSVRGTFQHDAMALSKDFLDLHCFHGHGAYTGFRNTIDNKLLPMRRELGIEMPWYANETAITMSQGAGERLQAETLYKKLLFAWSRGATGYTWYNLRSKGMNEANDGEHGYGMLTMDMDPRAVYIAWNNVTKLYGRKGFKEEKDLGPAYSCFVASNANETVAGIWAETGRPSVLRIVTAAASVEAVDMFGNRQPLVAAADGYRLPVGGEPVSLVLPAECDFSVEEERVPALDVWDETCFDIRQGGEDLNRDGFAQGIEVNDSLLAGVPGFLPGNGTLYGTPTTATYRIESVVSPATGAVREEPVLHFTQPVEWTNAQQTAGVIWPNAVRWPQLLTVGKPGYAFFVRVRPDVGTPVTPSAWIVNFGNENAGGALCGFTGANPNTRALSFWTMKRSVGTGINVTMGLWTDIAVTFSGDTIAWAVCQEGGEVRTGSYTLPGFSYAPSSACTLGTESCSSAPIAYTNGYSQVYGKCFRGSISRFAFWERALTAEELSSLASGDVSDVFRVGAVNGHGYEFGEGAQSADAVDALAGRWRLLPRTLSAGEALTLSVPVTAEAATAPQTLLYVATPDSPAGTLSVTVNGASVGTLSVPAGGSAELEIPAGRFASGDANVLRLTRTDAGAPLKMDALRLMR